MLKVDTLNRSFGSHHAVQDVSFTVDAGKLIGFVGSNGAGKTTTMRMIMGLLAADSGEVRWNGAPITAKDRARFGYMPEERGLYAKQPVLAQLVYLAELKGMNRFDATAEATTLMERFGLGERIKDKLEKLSLGNQQRVQIAASVMACPTCLILDEPFSGLDPKAIDEMAGLLAEFAATGVPVLFSSHQLDLIDRLCDGLIILSNGQIVASGSKQELENRGAHKHRLVTDNDVAWVREIAGLQVDDVDGNTALVEVIDPGVEKIILAEAINRGNVLEFSRIRPTLSEIYREVTA